MNRGLLEHPTREQWNPGAGGMCRHSIQIDPTDAARSYVGISAAGVFRSERAARAGRRPTPAPRPTSCPSRTPRSASDRGASWERLDGNGLPSSFGFGLALDPADPDIAFVVPEEGAENRVTCDGRLGVYRTGDAGASWELAADGLPERAWVGVLREGMAFDERGVFFGTQNGSVYALAGEKWVEAARDLPPVHSVEVASWP